MRTSRPCHRRRRNHVHHRHQTMVGEAAEEAAVEEDAAVVAAVPGTKEVEEEVATATVGSPATPHSREAPPR